MCGRVCLEEAVGQAECAENNVQKKLCVCHSTSRVFDLLFDILSHTHIYNYLCICTHNSDALCTHTHTHIHVSLRFFSLSAYLRRIHLAASLPLSLSLSSTCSLTLSLHNQLHSRRQKSFLVLFSLPSALQLKG